MGETIDELNKQYGLDIPDLIEQSMIKELSEHINKKILEKIFDLGYDPVFENMKRKQKIRKERLSKI